MFEWKVEDMSLLNEKTKSFLGKERIFGCESKVSRKDKIAFVDSQTSGKLSYLLSLIEKFESEKESLPKDNHGYIKSVSLKAWINRNEKDGNSLRPVVDNYYRYGEYNILGSERYIQYNSKGIYDTYDDLVDECFHRLLKMCLIDEELYFKAHDDYSIAKKQVSEYSEKYNTTFGAHIGFCSNGRVLVLEDGGKERDITMEELEVLSSNYRKLDNLVEKLTKDTHISYGESRDNDEPEPEEDMGER